MEIKTIKIKDVKRAEYNPRKISPEEMEKLKTSLKTFGCVRPLLINRRNSTLIAGHQMLEAAKQIGMKELPYIEVDLPLDKEKALNVVLNKVQGEFNYDLLGPLLKELDEGEVLDLTGFDVSDIDLMEKLSDEGSVIVDEVPEEAKNKEYSLTFDFDDEKDMIKVRDFFTNKKYNWKGKNKLNSNHLIKILENQKV